MVAELATNALKYAVADGRTLLIELDFPPAAGIAIRVRDNGGGFPEAIVQGAREPGPGLGLVRSIVGHGLHGTVSLANDDGAVITIAFPAEHTADAAAA